VAATAQLDKGVGRPALALGQRARRIALRSELGARVKAGHAWILAAYHSSVRRLAVFSPVVASAVGYLLVVRGALTLDLDLGRRIRPLGPIARRIAAPQETVFDVIAAPYLGRTPRAMHDKLQVLERGADMVLAAHFTTVGRMTTTTVETVRFERPERVTFHLVRGPVPHVLETYELRAAPNGTEFVYSGELGADLWQLGRWWANRVARAWEQTVAKSIDSIQAEAERRTHTSPAH
jgi:hypothetical protein